MSDETFVIAVSRSQLADLRSGLEVVLDTYTEQLDSAVTDQEIQSAEAIYEDAQYLKAHLEYQAEHGGVKK